MPEDPGPDAPRPTVAPTVPPGIANDDEVVLPLSYFVVKYGGLLLLLVGVGVGVVLALRFLR